MIIQLNSTVKNEVDNKLNGSVFMDKMPQDLREAFVIELDLNPFD